MGIVKLSYELHYSKYNNMCWLWFYKLYVITLNKKQFVWQIIFFVLNTVIHGYGCLFVVFVSNSKVTLLKIKAHLTNVIS